VESKYCPADLNKIATECHLLNADQQETLQKLLRKFAHLFDGACHMFTIAKPDKILRSLADLRELDKRIKRKPLLIPKINDLLQK
jgi:hypothetical protein